jgi:hypothetical protein
MASRYCARTRSLSRQTTSGGSPEVATSSKTVPSPRLSQSRSSGTGTQGAWEETSATCTKSGRGSLSRAQQPVERGQRELVRHRHPVEGLAPVAEVLRRQHRLEAHPGGFRPVERDGGHHRRRPEAGPRGDVEQGLAARWRAPRRSGSGRRSAGRWRAWHGRASSAPRASARTNSPTASRARGLRAAPRPGERVAVDFRVEGRVDARPSVALDEDDHHVPVERVQERPLRCEGIGRRGGAEGAQLRHRARGHLHTLDPDAGGEGGAGDRDGRGPERDASATSAAATPAARTAAAPERRAARTGRPMRAQTPVAHQSAAATSPTTTTSAAMIPVVARGPTVPARSRMEALDKRHVRHGIEPARQRREGGEIGGLEHRDGHERGDERDAEPPARYPGAERSQREKYHRQLQREDRERTPGRRCRMVRLDQDKVEDEGGDDEAAPRRVRWTPSGRSRQRRRRPVRTTTRARPRPARRAPPQSRQGCRVPG